MNFSSWYDKRDYFHHLDVSFLNFPKLSTLKITLFFNSRKQKTEAYCGKSSTFRCYSVDSKSSHSPNPAFCCPLNSPSSALLASCYYTLLSLGNFPPKYLSTQAEEYSFGVMKINYLSKPLKQITIQVPLQIPTKNF